MTVGNGIIITRKPESPLDQLFYTIHVGACVSPLGQTPKTVVVDVAGLDKAIALP